MQKVILDVDTGSDDAIAIMLAVCAKELDILGITVTWGNRPVDACVKNTLKVLDLMKSSIPVYRGCPAPMVRWLTEQRNAALKKDGISITIDGKEYSVHPESFDLPEPSRTPENIHACSYLVETLKNSSEKITVVTVGPMTNLGMAVRMDPSICNHIEKVIIMGGAVGKGNITAAAEANFYHDPEAAKILIETRIDALKRMNNGNGWSDAIHDALAVAWLLDPEVITETLTVSCDIDINGGACDGMLVADERMGYEPDETVRTVIAMKADKKRFFNMLKEAFAP